MATSMQLQPQSEVTMTLTAIVFKPDSVVTIGRGAEGAGRLPQDWLQVSSKHCAIRYDADKGTWLVKDTSTNGSFVNNVRVGKGNEAPLKVNDVLRLSQAVGEKNKLIEYKFIEAPQDAQSLAGSEKRASQEEPAGTPAEKRARLESPVAQPKENVAPNDVQRVAQLHRSNEELRKQLGDARARGDALQGELDAMTKQWTAALEAVDDVKEQNRQAAEELQSAAEARDAAKAAADAAVGRADAAAAAEEEAKRSAEALRCQLDAAKADRMELEAAHAKLQAEHDASTAELGTAQQRVDELNRQREEICAASDQKTAELTQKIEELTQLLQERSTALRAIAEAETEAALRAEANAQRETGEEEQSPEQASMKTELGLGDGNANGMTPDALMARERNRIAQRQYRDRQQARLDEWKQKVAALEHQIQSLTREKELERELAAAVREQACVRDSALEAIGADLTTGAAAARAALEAEAKLEAALAVIADAKSVMHAALLQIQSKQAAAMEAAHVGKARSDDKPGNGGSPAASECLATQAVSTLLSPSKSAGRGSVRKAVIVETSQEGKPEHSQRAGTATQVSGGVGSDRGAVTSPPPRGDAALDQDETQVHPADDMAVDGEPVDDEPGKGLVGHEQTAAKQPDSGVEPAAEADGDGRQPNGDDGDHEQQQQEQQGVGSNSQQGERSQRRESTDGVPAQELAADDHAAEEPAAAESHPADAAMQEEDAVAPPQADSSPAVDGLADDMEEEERSSPGDDEVRDSESNGYHIAAEGQAQADTLVAPSMANVSMGNSLDGML